MKSQLHEDFENWYNSLNGTPTKYRLVAVAMSDDGEDSYWAPIAVATDNPADYKSAIFECIERFKENFGGPPLVCFTHGWKPSDDFESIRQGFNECAIKAYGLMGKVAIDNWTDDGLWFDLIGVKIWSSWMPSMNASDQFDLAKDDNLQLSTPQIKKVSRQQLRKWEREIRRRGWND